jgi:hypothetical protein
MTLCFAIGAVVVGVPTTSQSPLSGQRSPVFAVVPIGAFVCVVIFWCGFTPSRLRGSHLCERDRAWLTLIAPPGRISGKLLRKTEILEQ